MLIVKRYIANTDLHPFILAIYGARSYVSSHDAATGHG